MKLMAVQRILPIQQALQSVPLSFVFPQGTNFEQKTTAISLSGDYDDKAACRAFIVYQVDKIKARVFGLGDRVL
jgi:hypothetical protein